MRGGAALGQHGDLGVGGAAVAGQRRLVVFSVGPQKPLHVPPTPLPLDLGLHLKRKWRNEKFSSRA